MKKVFALCLAIILAVSFAACSEKQETAVNEPADTNEAPHSLEVSQMMDTIKDAYSLTGETTVERDGDIVTVSLYDAIAYEFVVLTADSIYKGDEHSSETWDKTTQTFIGVQTGEEASFAKYGHPEIKVTLRVYTKYKENDILVFEIKGGEAVFDIMPKLIEYANEHEQN